MGFVVVLHILCLLFMNATLAERTTQASPCFCDLARPRGPPHIQGSPMSPRGTVLTQYRRHQSSTGCVHRKRAPRVVRYMLSGVRCVRYVLSGAPRERAPSAV